MKNFSLFLFALLTLNVLSAQNIVYDIQLAAYTTPNAADFKALKSIGYLYEQPLPTGLSKVFMGTFASEAIAKTKLEAAKKKGYKDAFLVKRDNSDKNQVYVVQMASYAQDAEVDWSVWRDLTKDLCAQVTESKLRICSGPYRSKAEADEAFEALGKKGSKDISVRKVNPEVLHEVTTFEMGPIAPVKAPLEVLDKRSVSDLQKVLKAEGYYTGAVDGSLGNGTKAALDKFKAESRRYQNAVKLTLADMQPEQNLAAAAAPGTLQASVDLIGEKPFTAEEELSRRSEPMAKVYLAYIYLADLVPTPDKTNTVNNLMYDAISKIFKSYKGQTRYDYSQKYSYDNVQQLLNHLRDMQMATYDEVAVPCWLFSKHPAEMQSAFAPYWNNSKDDYRLSPGCENQGPRFEEIIILTQLAEELNPSDDHDGGSHAAERSASATELAVLFASPLALPSTEATELTEWNRRLMTGLENFAAGGKLQRKMVNTFEVAYYEALIKVEYFFLQKGLGATDAHAAALKVINRSVNLDLNSYLK